MKNEKITIYHNPRCRKSREALAILEDKSLTIDVVKYLEDTPSVEELNKILAKLHLKPHEILRTGESIYKEKFKGLNLNDHEWVKIMVENPQLIERPIVIKGNKAVIGRPPSNVLELL